MEDYVKIRHWNKHEQQLYIKEASLRVILWKMNRKFSYCLRLFLLYYFKQ